MGYPRRSLTAFAAITATMLLGAAPASADGIAYIQNGHVWVSTLDGSKKVQLSDGNAWWNTVGQSATGGVVATRNEPGKIGQLSTFRVWNPNGTVKDDGPLSPLNWAGSSLAVPLGLELNAGNSLLIYGYSSYVYNFPVGSLTEGYALLPSATRVAPNGTFTSTKVLRPSLVAGRIIGTPDGSTIALEDAGGNNAGSFSPWPGLSFSGIPDGRLKSVQASTSGQYLTAQIDIDPAGTPQLDDAKVLVVRTAGLLGNYIDDCYLPVVGKAQWSDVSADGTRVAWADQQGVKVAPMPNLRSGGPANCEMTGAPTLIAAGGTSPAFGPIDVNALHAARNPAPSNPVTPGTGSPGTGTQESGTPGTVPPGTVTPGPSTASLTAALPARLAAKTLAAGKGRIQVAVGAAGRVTVTVTAPARAVGRKGKPVLLATGRANASGPGQLSIRLNPTTAGKQLKSKLRGKRITAQVTFAGKTIRKSAVLK